MIYVKTTLNAVRIPKETEMTVYSKNEYFLDERGEPTQNIEESDGISYGDVCVRTPTAEYAFCRVYAAYEVVARANRYLLEHENDPTIVVDLEALCEDAFGFRMYGEFEVR